MNITKTKNPIRKGEEKETLEFILTNCFRSGFGTLSKTELDLILFSAILKFADQKDISDYALSKYLQITQQRVRNLKEKSSVKYFEFSQSQAVDIFVSQIARAHVQENYFDIPIYDVRVKNEMEAILEENNILLHTQLNPKIFRIRIDDFLELFIAIEKTTDPTKKIDAIEKDVIDLLKRKATNDKKLANKITPANNKISDISKSTIKEAMIKGGISFGVDLLASLIPGGAFLSQPVKNLLKNIQDKI